MSNPEQRSPINCLLVWDFFLLFCWFVAKVVLDKEDPSLPRGEESNRDPRVVTGSRICRVKEARTPCMAHAPDRDWDIFLRGAVLYHRRLAMVLFRVSSEVQFCTTADELWFCSQGVLFVGGCQGCIEDAVVLSKLSHFRQMLR